MLLACRLFAYYVNVYQSDDKLRSHDLISPLEYMTPNIRRKLHVVPHLLFRVLNPDSCTMYMSPKKCVFLLTYLLTLSRAVPSPPILPTSTLNISAADTSLLNSTLTAVIPTFFKVIPSLPLDEPVLNARYTLMLTLHVLGYLALDDFEGEQQSRTWRSTLQHVGIDVIGPELEVGSALAKRKYAVWGIYKAVHVMVAQNDFRPRNYELYWKGALVGWVEFNNGAPAALGIGTGTANETGTALQQKSLSALPTTLPNVTTVTDPAAARIAFSYELSGRTIGESNIFMTLFTGILKAAPYPRTERVISLTVNSRTFDSFLSFLERQGAGPAGPFFQYGQLIQILTQLPAWIISHGSQWTEAEMIVSIDGKVVGVGVLKWQIRQGVGTADGGDVSTS